MIMSEGDVVPRLKAGREKPEPFSLQNFFFLNEALSGKMRNLDPVDMSGGDVVPRMKAGREKLDTFSLQNFSK